MSTFNVSLNWKFSDLLKLNKIKEETRKDKVIDSANGTLGFDGVATIRMTNVSLSAL